jgi:hypothetical protein
MVLTMIGWGARKLECLDAKKIELLKTSKRSGSQLQAF